MKRSHGGTDALGTPRYDFSTNSNACGPCPAALTLIQQADARAYPDASYTALRSQLAAFHGVEVSRVVLAGSASEFIFRMTALVAKKSVLKAEVSVPAHCYGDYAQAAQAWGLGVTPNRADAQLVWACEPSSPLGGAHLAWPDSLESVQQIVVLDCAYEPLRLGSVPSLSASQREAIWQLWTPNKALGLTGIRAAYAIAPAHAALDAAALEQLGASWPLGVHGVALLTAWTDPVVQAWLRTSLQTLSVWKTRQIDLLQNIGWLCHPSDSNFFCASQSALIGMGALPELLRRLRAAGIKLRDATSFGLPDSVRLSVQPHTAQDALLSALRELT